MNLQPFPAIATNVSLFFVWPCKQVINSIILMLHVSEHGKNVYSFHYIECCLQYIKMHHQKNSFHRPKYTRSALCALIFIKKFQVAFWLDISTIWHKCRIPNFEFLPSKNVFFAPVRPHSVSKSILSLPKLCKRK